MSEHTGFCLDIKRDIWTEGPGLAPKAHLETCDVCREQARRAADLDAALQGLRTRDAETPTDLYAAIVGAVNRGRVDRARGIVAHPRFWRGAAVGAAAATAVAGLIVARKLSQRPAQEGEEAP